MTQPPAEELTQQALSYARHQATKSLIDLAALMDRTGADCARCLEGVTDAQAEFRIPGEWSIKETLGHLLQASSDVNRAIAALAKGEPTRPAGGAIGVSSGGDRPFEELRRDLAGLWQETARLVSSLPEDGDLASTRAHPWFGELNFKEWIAFQRVHAMDHIQQVEKIKAHSQYPKAHPTSSGQD